MERQPVVRTHHALRTARALSRDVLAAADGSRPAEHYEKYDDAFQFIRDVACDWDDSKYLEAEPAEYITVARKAKGTDNWFVGGKTNNARQTTVKLDFLDAGAKYDCAIYQDGKNADYETNPKAYTILHRTVKKGDVLKVKQARGGGFAVSLMKK